MWGPVGELKTKENDASVLEFLGGVADESRRQDALALLELMQELTGLTPKMWGGSIVGFGSYHYKYASGHEGDACLVGFSPRKAGLSIYLGCGIGQDSELFGRLGKHKMGQGCLTIKRLKDVDLAVLRQLVEESFRIASAR
jgi:hypothetical protein